MDNLKLVEYVVHFVAPVLAELKLSYVERVLLVELCLVQTELLEEVRVQVLVVRLLEFRHVRPIYNEASDEHHKVNQ